MQGTKQSIIVITQPKRDPRKWQYKKKQRWEHIKNANRKNRRNQKRKRQNEREQNEKQETERQKTRDEKQGNKEKEDKRRKNKRTRKGTAKERRRERERESKTENKTENKKGNGRENERENEREGERERDARQKEREKNRGWKGEFAKTPSLFLPPPFLHAPAKRHNPHHLKATMRKEARRSTFWESSSFCPHRTQTSRDVTSGGRGGGKDEG